MPLIYVTVLRCGGGQGAWFCLNEDRKDKEGEGGEEHFGEGDILVRMKTNYTISCLYNQLELSFVCPTR